MHIADRARLAEQLERRDQSVPGFLGENDIVHEALVFRDIRIRENVLVLRLPAPDVGRRIRRLPCGRTSGN